MIYLVQIFYVVICVIEAKLEQYVIAGKGIDISTVVDKKEHQWSAVYSIVCGVLFFVPTLIASDNYFLLLLIIVLPVIRRLFFNYTLKIFRGISDHPLHIIDGSGTVDKLSRKIFGSHGGFFEIAACMALILVFNYLIIKFT